MLAENVASRQENNTRKKTKNVTIKLNTLNQVSELSAPVCVLIVLEVLVAVVQSI